MIDHIEIGDCREIMPRWIGEGVRVQTCVTSPPYWGLRDYGVDRQIGLEATPEEYVANIVKVFRLVRDLLADDGTLWLNLGDSYASATGVKTNQPQQSRNGQRGVVGPRDLHPSASRANLSAYKNFDGLKPKDLIGIPWRVAFALQADGWYLRSDIIWSKPNPMPESVTDRPTKAHEYLFLLAKRERYYYDAQAIAEQSMQPFGKALLTAQHKRAVLQDITTSRLGTNQGASSRNRRTVWTIATQPYDGAHFACFPEALIEPCILAGSRSNDRVFDPFMGSGTTAKVAQRFGRRFLGCDLNPAYAQLQRDRTCETIGMAL